MLSINDQARQQAQSLLDFIDASPSPWHAVSVLESELQKAGYQALNETESWSLEAGKSYYVVRDGSSIISFKVGKEPISASGFRIIGAHTDSPGFRVKPQPAQLKDEVLRLGIEVYGGPILATFTDRELSLAGRVQVVDGNGVLSTKLLHIAKPLLRLPNLAIHMNREVNEKGLLLQKQLELPLLMGLQDSTSAEPPSQVFRSLLSDQLGVASDAIRSWELNVFDTQPGTLYGISDEFIANSQLDNLASCHAAHQALLSLAESDPASTAVCAFFDHEEVGSNSHKGADGSFLPDVLQRITDASGEGGADCFAKARANSMLISADMAHAWHPNFSNYYEPDHKALVNQGPVIKINSNVRYTSEAVSQAIFSSLCEREGVPHQLYSHRTDLPCGSTIGPMTASRLGIRSVDVGNPMWAMHSARESAGVLDHHYMIRVMSRFFSDSISTS